MGTMGSRVRDLRIKNKLTQKDMAGKIGISHSTLSKIESGYKENANKEIILKIADLFDVSIDYLFGKSKNPDIHDVEEEFVSRLELDLSDEELLDRFDINFDGRNLSAAEAKTALAVFRAMFQPKQP